jgi:hypothetical protein
MALWLDASVGTRDNLSFSLPSVFYEYLPRPLDGNDIPVESCMLYADILLRKSSNVIQYTDVFKVSPLPPLTHLIQSYFCLTQNVTRCHTGCSQQIGTVMRNYKNLL